MSFYLILFLSYFICGNNFLCVHCLEILYNSELFLIYNLLILVIICLLGMIFGKVYVLSNNLLDHAARLPIVYFAGLIIDRSCPLELWNYSYCINWMFNLCTIIFIWILLVVVGVWDVQIFWPNIFERLCNLLLYL